MDLGGISGTLMGWAQTWLFWGGILLFITFGFFGGLYLRKKRKLKYPALELVPIGANKLGFVSTTCGFFRKHRILWGLLDYGGEEEMCLKDGRKVLNGSSEDFMEINGQRGAVVIRKGDDPEILTQVNEFELNKISLGMIMSIAPGDYRDGANDLMDRAERESMKKWEKVMPYVVIGGVILFAIIVLIFTIQFANNSLDKADNILKRAEEKDAKIPEEVGKAVGKAIREAMNEAPPSTAP